MFKQFIILYSIIVIHEFGHILVSLKYKWNIKQICFYPFGGYTLFEDYINRGKKEELLVLISGPIFQLIYIFIVTLFYNNNIINYYTYNIFYNYNNLTLIFNLIPIYPLDGSKLLNILFNIIIPFKKSHILSLYLSYFFILIALYFFNSKINILIIFSILIIKVIKEHKDHKYIFNKFLLERHLNNKTYKKNNYINGIKIYNMNKYKNNIFVINKIPLKEDIVLKKMFSDEYIKKV